jgi:hypothetical protein
LGIPAGAATRWWWSSIDEDHLPSDNIIDVAPVGKRGGQLREGTAA